MRMVQYASKGKEAVTTSRRNQKGTYALGVVRGLYEKEKIVRNKKSLLGLILIRCTPPPSSSHHVHSTKWRRFVEEQSFELVEGDSGKALLEGSKEFLQYVGIALALEHHYWRSCNDGLAEATLVSKRVCCPACQYSLKNQI